MALGHPGGQKSGWPSPRLTPFANYVKFPTPIPERWPPSRNSDEQRRPIVQRTAERLRTQLACAPIFATFMDDDSKFVVQWRMATIKCPMPGHNRYGRFILRGHGALLPLHCVGQALELLEYIEPACTNPQSSLDAVRSIQATIFGPKTSGSMPAHSASPLITFFHFDLVPICIIMRIKSSAVIARNVLDRGTRLLLGQIANPTDSVARCFRTT
jgi:hypothetical protein